MIGHPSRRKRPPAGGFTLIEVLTVIGVILTLITLLLPAVQSAREAARQTHCRNNLLQIAIALQNYEMAFEVLPPGTVNPTGPILNVARPSAYHVSWTVAILPQLEMANVYHHFDFRRGVYDPRNRPVQQLKVSVFACPSSSSGGSYAGCYNSREVPIDVNADGVLFLNSSVRFEDIADGCGSTLAVGETEGGPPVWGWISGTRDTLRNTGTVPNSPVAGRAAGEPVYEDYYGRAGTDVTDLLLDEARLLSEEELRDPKWLLVGGFRSSHKGGAQFAFCDGSVRFISESVDQTVFQKLGARADGSMPEQF